jgi:hypothetical protein
MTDISRVALFGKLNGVTYKSIDAATVFCKLRSNPYVELVHWVHALLQVNGCDWSYIIAYFRLDPQRLATDLVARLDTLPTGAKTLDFSNEVEEAVHSSWGYATLMFASPGIRSGYLLVGILKTKSLSAALNRISPELSKISVETLTDRFAEITKGSIEEGSGPQDGSQLLAQSPQERDIFLCYRRSDTRHITGRIFDRLEREFGADRVFKDVNSIPVGVADFAAEIRAQISAAKIMLVVIGEQWMTDADESGKPRILGDEDFVHIELKCGLDRQMAIIPLLCDEAAMPSEKQLPPALKPFIRCQGMSMRADPDFNNDMKKLIAACRNLMSSREVST